MTHEQLIQDYFRAYETGNRKTVDQLLCPDFTFTSANDNQIDKSTYFQRCWEHHKKCPVFTLEKIIEKENDVFVLYRCNNNTGKTFRNTELFCFEGNKIKSIEVYFGEVQFKEEVF